VTRSAALAGAVLALAMAMAVPTRHGSAQEPGEPAGQALFREHCGLCHVERGFGTRVLARRMPVDQASLEARSNLTAPYVELVVRRGLGSMPQIRRAELDDASLRQIAKYLEQKP
jgi:mono/diheme cytochrome c family protein